MKRNVYLAMKSLEEAKDLFLGRFGNEKRTIFEEVPVEESLGRVTAEPVFAKLSAPTEHCAAMDGVAVRAHDTYGTTERDPGTLELDRDAVWINTGQTLPQGFDAVIMVEKLHQPDDSVVEIRAPAHPWQHVRKVGEDIVATQLLLPRHHRIRPADMGALISGGIFALHVWKRPSAAILPTGSELVHHKDLVNDRRVEPGRIIEYNSIILSSLVRECGAVPEVYEITPDREERIIETVQKAVRSDADIIIVNAGSSAGGRDYTAHVIRELGEVLVHGVAMMPGKPTILGVIEDKPVVGNPGFTVSAVLSFEQFVRPLLLGLQGISPPPPATIRAHPSRDIPSRPGIDEFVRLNIGRIGERAVATPLPRAAGSITSLTRAEGILRIPALSEGVSRDEEVEVELLVPEEELDRTVVIIGSHDITVDLLADEIRRLGRDVRVSSGNVGSLGGLLAVRKGNAHLCGTHLLDPESGDYNVPYIDKYLKGLPVSLFHMVGREQGLMVAKGNPKRILGLEDLAGGDVKFINRQAGSGTRVLLDYQLDRSGIDPARIPGYDHEEYTHMAVAVDVLSGAADCGMGILAAARALDLDFVPVVKEQYELVIPRDHLEMPSIKLLLETIRSPGFRERVSGLGGYDPSRSGELRMEIG
ncbi:MAG: molybdopterin biosynthesis protein [Thermodesulfobacteriota bacterium]